MRVMLPKGARSPVPDWRLSHAFSRRTAHDTNEHGSNVHCHPDARLLYVRVTSHTHEPVRVYDTSGPWGDPDFRGTVEEGLPPLRAKWIRDRGDVEDYAGRAVQPIDDGYLSQTHAAHVKSKRPTQASPARTAERLTSNSNGNDSSVNARLASSFVIHHSSFAARTPLLSM